MKIFVTGGTGLIGQALIQSLMLKDKELDCTIFTRFPAAARALNFKGLNYIDNLNQLSFKELDVIVNLAGEPIVNKRWSEKQKQTLCDSRWQLTRNIVKKINNEVDRNSPIRFISGSAVGYYGRQGANTITESYTNCYPEFSHILCKTWEGEALRAQHANVALLRTGIVLSPSAGALKKMLLPFKLGLGGRTASGTQYLPWIHIEDMVRAIVFLIENPELTGAFNVTAPSPVTNDEFSRALAHTLKRPAILPMPKFLVRLLFGEMGDLLIYGQNAIPERLLEVGFKFHYKNLPLALANLLLNKK